MVSDLRLVAQDLFMLPSSAFRAVSISALLYVASNWVPAFTRVSNVQIGEGVVPNSIGDHRDGSSLVDVGGSL